MKRTLLLLSALVLAGCSAPPIKVMPSIGFLTGPEIEARRAFTPGDRKVDERCFDYARYARAIANMREVGIKQSDLPTAGNGFFTFPVLVVQDDVYANQNVTPVGIESRHLGFCLLNGYEKLLAQLQIDEANRALPKRTMTLDEYRAQPKN